MSAVTTMILYATKTGSARQCAEILAEQLPSSTVHDLGDGDPDIDGAHTVIIGSGVRMRHLYEPARGFLARHRETLLHKNVALFLCGHYPDTHPQTIEKDVPADFLRHALCVSSVGGTPPFQPTRDADWVSRPALDALAVSVSTGQRASTDLRTGAGGELRQRRSARERPPRRTVTAAEVEISPLLAAHAGRIDAVDAWQTPILPDDVTDAPSWNETLSTTHPGWVTPLLVVRDWIARIAGLHLAREDGVAQRFPTLASSEEEIITGDDDSHLSFRVSTRRHQGHMVITTTVTIGNRLGRLYWAVVRLVHPLVVRSSLKVMRRAGS